MKFSLILALTLAALTMHATAQKYQKPKARPSHSVDKDEKSQPRSLKVTAPRDSAAQELHKAEQSGARMSVSRKAGSDKAARTAQLARVQKQEANPPIHFTAGKSSGGGSKGKQSNSLKGRLRQKGNHK
jgi:hypothetical protein